MNWLNAKKEKKMFKYIFIALVIVGCTKQNVDVENKLTAIIVEDNLPINNEDQQIKDIAEAKFKALDGCSQLYIVGFANGIKDLFRNKPWVNCTITLNRNQKDVWALYWSLVGWASYSDEAKQKFCSAAGSLVNYPEEQRMFIQFVYTATYLSFFKPYNMDACLMLKESEAMGEAE